MADLFYRGFEATSPVTSGTRHLVAAAGRLFWAAGHGLANAPGETGKRLRELLTEDNLKVMAYVLAAWVIANIVGQPLAGVVDGVLAGLGVLTLAGRAIKLAKSLKDYAVTAYQASDETQIARAGGYFGAALGEIGVTTIELVLGHKTFKGLREGLANRGLLGRITGKPLLEPPPRTAQQPPRTTEPPPRTPEPPPARRAEPPPRSEPPARRPEPPPAPPERPGRLNRFGRRAGRELKDAVKDPRGPGLAHTRDFVPALVGGLMVLGLVGAGVGVAVVATRRRSRSSEEERRG